MHYCHTNRKCVCSSERTGCAACNCCAIDLHAHKKPGIVARTLGAIYAMSSLRKHARSFGRSPAAAAAASTHINQSRIVSEFKAVTESLHPYVLFSSSPRNASNCMPDEGRRFNELHYSRVCDWSGAQINQHVLARTHTPRNSVLPHGRTASRMMYGVHLMDHTL